MYLRLTWFHWKPLQTQSQTDTHLQPYLIRAALLVLSLLQLAHDWTRLGQNTWSKKLFLPSLLSLSSSCPLSHPSTTASLPALLSANPLSAQSSVAPRHPEPALQPRPPFLWEFFCNIRCENPLIAQVHWVGGRKWPLLFKAMLQWTALKANSADCCYKIGLMKHWVKIRVQL